MLVVLGMLQSQSSSGDMKVVVADTSGAVFAGAAITVLNLDTGVERSASSDDGGGFTFYLLPPAQYEVKVHAVGFAAYARRPVQIVVGETVSISIVLQPDSVAQEVWVQDVAPLIEIGKTQQADTITEKQIDNLPINERNFLNFSLLTPGVTDARALISFSLPQAPTSGLSFAGQSGRANNVTIDGVDNNDSAVAAVRSTLSQEAVQEFQINRSNFSAEFGRAGGGLINIVSRSGSNRFGGTVFAFLRDQMLDARNAFAFGPNGSRIDPAYDRLQSGFSLSGPLKKDRTFAFLSYEAMRQRESRFVTFLENADFFQPTASQRELIQGLRDELKPCASESVIYVERGADHVSTVVPGHAWLCWNPTAASFLIETMKTRHLFGWIIPHRDRISCSPGCHSRTPMRPAAESVD